MAKKHRPTSQVLKLKQQLEGKPLASSVSINPSPRPVAPSGSFTLPTNLNFNPTPSTAIHQDTAYLRKDMTKIALLASLAIGAQLILYLALRSHLIRGF